MDRKVVWSPEAVEDVELLAQYIARDSEFHAQAVAAKNAQAARSIQDFPTMGRVRSELQDESIRERIFCNCRLLYHTRRAAFSSWQ